MSEGSQRIAELIAHPLAKSVPMSEREWQATLKREKRNAHGWTHREDAARICSKISATFNRAYPQSRKVRRIHHDVGIAYR